jgi:hypothetical protein
LIFSKACVAKAIAALNAVKFSPDLECLAYIMLEGDSLSVVTAVKNTGPNWSRYEHIIEDTKVVLQGLRNWQICHRLIPREQTIMLRMD